MREQAFIADWSWPYSITLRSCTAILKEIWYDIEWDGERASFFALREIEEGQARKRLLERK